jgi:hypothetical protein
VALKIGDWVRSYSTGIWQIYRILDYKCKDPVTGKDVEKTTIFSKRFVSDSFKRSFKEECCDPAFVYFLDMDKKKELDSFIESKPGLYQKFIDHEPKKIDCIYNARIGIPLHKDSQMIEDKLKVLGPIKDIEINSKLNELGFDTKAMPSWTVQFVSNDFACVDGYLSFQFVRVLEH